MKKYLLLVFIISLSPPLMAQVSNTDALDKLKKEGKLTGQEILFNPNGGTSQFKIVKPSKKNKTSSSGSCDCWIPRDSTFSVAPLDGSGGSGAPNPGDPNYACDDWSTNAIATPFNFCLYGTNYNSVYINNNGNVSFGAPYSTFTANSFPDPTYVMIAPFWGDVDTRGPGSRFVHYKLTPTYMVVQWDSVGYYFEHDDKLNTFQLVITNGNDPIIGSGNNVSFCYKDMNWTTGDASGGSNGFSGTAATVGINKGDGINFFEIGLFDQAGSSYQAPSTPTSTSGIDWLDNKSFVFDCCGGGSNLPPIAADASACGDTITICGIGDTLIYTTNFSAPEVNQVVTCTGNAGTLSGNFFVLNSTSGVNASLTFMITTNGIAAGYYNVSIVGTDNGSPVLSTTSTYVIHIINNPIPGPIVTLSPNPACLSQNPVVSLSNCNLFDTHIWSNGDTACSFPVTTTDTLYLTVTKTGCYKSKVQYIKVSPNPVITTGGVLSYCPPTNGTSVFVNQPISQGTAPYTFNWDGGVSVNDTLFNALNGVHTVVVTDANGCAGTASLTVTSNAPVLAINSAGNLCLGAVTLSPSITNGISYNWSPGGATTQNISVSTGGTYSLSVVVNNCTVTSTYILATPVHPTVTVTGDTTLCPLQNSVLTASAVPAGSYTYNWYQGSTNIGNGATQIVSAAGTNYSVIATNTNTQCGDTLLFFVNMYTNPNVTVNGNVTICAGHPDLLIANPSLGNPAYTYLWRPSSATTQTINVTAAGVYSVVVTDVKGCRDSAKILVKLSTPKVIAAGAKVCPGYKATLHASGSGTAPLNYLWYPDLSTGTTFTASSGNYSVVLTDVYGCKDSIAVVIGLNPLPNASIAYTPSSPVEAGTAVAFTDVSTITTGSVVSNAWTFGDTAIAINTTNISHTYNNGGHYVITLIVKSDKGCLDTATTSIDIQYSVTAPNIITPNGDNINEYLEFKNLLYFKNNKIWIYNRWGTLLYHSDDYKNNWTGAPYSDGTYFYVLEIPEKKKTFKGSFTSLK